jgi:hypothetical protein
MKTTDKDYTLENKQIRSALNSNPLKSLRPQKSMVRIKSLKPKRLNVASKIRVKTTQA